MIHSVRNQKQHTAGRGIGRRSSSAGRQPRRGMTHPIRSMGWPPEHPGRQAIPSSKPRTEGAWLRNGRSAHLPGNPLWRHNEWQEPFSPPSKADRWAGVRDATSYGYSAPQTNPAERANAGPKAHGADNGRFRWFSRRRRPRARTAFF